MLKIVLQGEYTDLNSYSTAERTHRHKAAQIKRHETRRVWADTKSQMNSQGLRIENYPVKVHFDWFCTNRKKDPDNIAFAKKYLLDGMVEADLLPNDGWNQIAGFSDDFHIDKENPRVEVTITW